MVIECPSCRTKFAVEPGLLAGVSQPRFHCSRCDHFFDGSKNVIWSESDDQPATSAPSFAPSSPATSSAPATPAMEEGFIDDTDLFARTPALSAGSQISVASSDALDDPWADAFPDEFGSFNGAAASAATSDPSLLRQAPEKRDISSNGRPSVSGKGGSVREPKEQLPLPLDYAGESGEPPLSPQLFLDDLEHEVEQPSDSVPSGIVIPWPSAGRDAFSTDLSGHSDRGQSFRSVAAAAEHAPWNEGVSWTLGDDEEDPKPSDLSNPIAGAPGSTLEVVEKPVRPRRVKATRPDAANGLGIFGRLPRSSSHPAILLIVPGILAIAILLVAAGKPVAFPPASLPGLFALPAEKVPMQGISVRRATTALLSLENGTRVLELKADVANETDQTVDHVLVETKLFNDGGQEIRSLIAPNPNQLEGTRVESLGADMLEELGMKAGAQKAMLEPGTTRPFRLILAGVPPEATDVGIRVYSVQHASNSPKRGL